MGTARHAGRALIAAAAAPRRFVVIFAAAGAVVAVRLDGALELGTIPLFHERAEALAFLARRSVS